jgi:hypothetical protein
LRASSITRRKPTALWRIFWQFIGILSLVGFVGAYFWWIVAAVPAVVAAVLLTRRTIRTAQAQAAELAAHNAELLERADQPAR